MPHRNPRAASHSVVRSGPLVQRPVVDDRRRRCRSAGRSGSCRRARCGRAAPTPTSTTTKPSAVRTTSPTSGGAAGGAALGGAAAARRARRASRASPLADRSTSTPSSTPTSSTSSWNSGRWRCWARRGRSIGTAHGGGDAPGRGVITTTSSASSTASGMEWVTSSVVLAPVLPDRRQLQVEPAPRQLVDGAERLVEQQQPGRRDEAAGDGGPLAHAARQLGRLGLLEPGEPDQLDRARPRAPGRPGGGPA